ncbi:HNH endonuclease [Caballeronia sp. GAFFF1]|uniref:HNH endonuclease n=1 Tax=Caballeronia sp. GAFFF1 TaxID=2921779 RepID=UPI0020291429|nr:HNH endonuclease [Caballeronia sp. GAFFF1]
MSEDRKYPANQALLVIDGALKQELDIHRFDDPKRSKAQLFAIGGPLGKQFAIVLGDTDVLTGHHPAQQTRIVLERCELPPLPGVAPCGDAYYGQRVKDQQPSKLAAPNQVSCVVADESSLRALLRWYAGNNMADGTAFADPRDMLGETRVEKAAADAGFDLTTLYEGNWLIFRSTSFTYRLGVSLQSGESYRVGFSDAELGQKAAADCSYAAVFRAGPWAAEVNDIDGYDALHRLLFRAATIFRLFASDGPAQFKAATRNLPASTEAERLVVERVGQGIFRNALIEYWQGRCAVTGLDVVPLLRASHIKPWADCETDDERLDVFNGLLLAPHLDALFDGGWITFTDTGDLLVSNQLHAVALSQIGFRSQWRLADIAPSHRPYLAFHRENVFRAR